MQARLSALEAQRDRLNALADQAETTADLLEIESQLSDVQYQLENYTRQLRSMDQQVSYSTVDIYLREVATLTPTGVTFGERIADAFGGGWDAFVGFLQGLVIALVYLVAGAADRSGRGVHPAQGLEKAAQEGKAAQARADAPARRVPGEAGRRARSPKY